MKYLYHDKRIFHMHNIEMIETADAMCHVVSVKTLPVFLLQCCFIFLILRGHLSNILSVENLSTA
jgi:hypothetical protein